METKQQELEQVKSTDVKFLEVKKSKQDGNDYYEYKEYLPLDKSLKDWADRYCALNKISYLEFCQAILDGLDLLIRSRVLNKKKPTVNDLLASYEADVEKVMKYVKASPREQEKLLSEYQNSSIMVSTKAKKISKETSSDLRTDKRRVNKVVLSKLTTVKL